MPRTRSTTKNENTKKTNLDSVFLSPCEPKDKKKIILLVTPDLNVLSMQRLCSYVSHFYLNLVNL